MFLVTAFYRSRGPARSAPSASRKSLTHPHVSTVLIIELGPGERKTRIKKSAAECLVRRLEADKVSRHLYRRRKPSPPPPTSAAAIAVKAPIYIPESLPPAEVPGLRFKQPLSALVLQANSLVVGFRRLRPEPQGAPCY